MALCWARKESCQGDGENDYNLLFGTMNEIEVYKEIKIIPNSNWGISVENFRIDIGIDGITISTYDIEGDRKASKLYVCMDFDEAEKVRDAITELLPVKD